MIRQRPPRRPARPATLPAPFRGRLGTGPARMAAGWTATRWTATDRLPVAWVAVARVAVARVAAACAVAAVAGLAAPASAAAQAAPGAGGPRVGLVLSGGSAKGLAHVGVLRVVEEAGVRVDVVTGTSMGSVIGGLYAIGLSPDSIAGLVSSADWGNVLTDGASRDRRFLHQRRFGERAVLSLPVRGGSVGLPTGAAVGSNIMRLAEYATWRAATTRSFDELPRPYAALATDIETGEAVVMRSGVLSEAMRASTAIPGVFEPIEIDGRLLVDGAVARNLPALDARDLGAEFVICSDVLDPLVSAEELESLLDVLDQVLTLAMRRETLRQREACDVLVRPDVQEISGLAFDEWPEWFERGEAAARPHLDALAELASEQGAGGARAPGPPPLPDGFLPDSVRVARIEVQGATRRQAEDFVLGELGLSEGSYVSAEALESRLRDIDATGLFGLVRSRLDEAEDGVVLTVRTQESPNDRLGVGLRYDDERRAALLFTTTLHNLLGYGSVTRFDLRVGEENRAEIAYLRRHGVTGRFEVGGALGWSQSPVRLPGPARPVTEFEVSRASTFFGIVGRRSTLLALEVLGEWAVSDLSGVPDVLLGSVSAVLDHESLDRIDFPGRGADAEARWEWGIADIAEGGGFSVLSSRARAFFPLHDRVTADFGLFVGLARGTDLPVHRTFFVGGAHPSAVFAGTQPLFHGLETQELTGSSAQVARAGLRVRLRDGLHLRLGANAGGTTEAWRLPVEDAVWGWAVTVGAETIVGPVAVEWGKATDRAGRLSVSVGRGF